MKYDVVASLLVREGLNSEAQVFVENAAKLVDQCVNFGTNVVTWINYASLGYPATIAATLLLYTLDHLDGVGILARSNAASPMVPLVRSEMEAVLSLMYLLEKDRDRRAVAYQVAYVHERLKSHQRLDPTTEMGKKHRSDLQKDRHLGGRKFYDLDTTKEIKNLESMLLRPEFVAAENEWRRMKGLQKKSTRFPWYSFYDGPKTIQALAEHLGLYAWYHELYHSYSEHTHVSATVRRIRQLKSGAPAFIPIRSPLLLDRELPMAIVMACASYQTILRELSPEHLEEYERWYREEMHEGLNVCSAHVIDDPDLATYRPTFRS